MDTQPELFAQHYAEAGLVEKSVAYWDKAGQRSAARSATAEAAAQFQKGLDQLALLPDTRERQRQELELRSALGGVLLAVKGQSAPETGLAYTRARELWERLGSPAEFHHVPYGQSFYHAARGELDLAQRLDEDFLRLSRQRDDLGGLVLAYLCSGRNCMFAGKFAISRLELEKVLALYDPVFHHALVHQVRLDPRVGSQTHLGIVLFCLGYPDQASARSKAAIAEARRLAHPASLAPSLSLDCMLLSLVGDNAGLNERANQLIAVTTEHGFPHWAAQGSIYCGWLKVENGYLAEGISLLQTGATAHRGAGAELWVPYFLVLLARAYEKSGQFEEANTQLNDALGIASRTGGRWLLAEVYRHKGQLLQRHGHTEAAEELYRKALSISKEQEAKLWELRAAVSLASLRRYQGRHAEARNFLAPVYGWFIEGFDTPDLKEAKALLDELSA